MGVYGDGEWVGVFLSGGYVSAPAVEGVAGVGLCGEGDVGVLCVAGFLWVDVDGSFSDGSGGEVVAWYAGAVDVVDVVVSSSVAVTGEGEVGDAGAGVSVVFGYVGSDGLVV